MVDWLEIKSNFAMIVGKSTDGKGVAHGNGKTLTSAYDKLNQYVVDRMKLSKSQGIPVDPRTLIPWDNPRSRFISYRTTYFRTKRASQQIGFGLTQEEAEQGLTIEDKLDKMCPFFDRMDVLFGNRQNVAPSFAAERPLSKKRSNDADTNNDVPDIFPNESASCNSNDDGIKIVHDDLLISAELENSIMEGKKACLRVKFHICTRTKN